MGQRPQGPRQLDHHVAVGSSDRLREEPLRFYVKIFLWGAVLVKVVGDGVRFIIRVGDAADVAEAARPARAVAVPARMASNSKKKPLSWK